MDNHQSTGVHSIINNIFRLFFSKRMGWLINPILSSPPPKKEENKYLFLKNQPPLYLCGKEKGFLKQLLHRLPPSVLINDFRFKKLFSKKLVDGGLNMSHKSDRSMSSPKKSRLGLLKRIILICHHLPLSLLFYEIYLLLQKCYKNNGFISVENQKFLNLLRFCNGNTQKGYHCSVTVFYEFIFSGLSLLSNYLKKHVTKM